MEIIFDRLTCGLLSFHCRDRSNRTRWSPYSPRKPAFIQFRPNEEPTLPNTIPQFTHLCFTKETPDSVGIRDPHMYVFSDANLTGLMGQAVGIGGEW